MDPDTPVAETIGAFEELAAEGRIRAYGGSNVDAAWLEEALRHGRPDWAQNPYSLLDRDDERQAPCRSAPATDSATRPFSPLAGGWLTGKYRRGEAPPAGSRMTLRPEPYLHLQEDAVYDALEAFEAQARERDTTPAALAFAWLLAQPHVTAVVIGPRRPDQLRPALEALDARALAARARRADRALRMSVLILSEHDVRRAAADGASASRRWTTCCGRSRAASSTSRSGRSPGRRTRDSLIGLMPSRARWREPAVGAEGDRDRAG